MLSVSRQATSSMDALMEAAAILGIDLNKFSAVDTMMDDDMSDSEGPGDTPEMSAYEKQRASLQTYLASLPYECESVEQMQAHLEEIVAKIIICAKAQNWLVLTTWDGMLQCWLLMRYPMPTPTRAKLVRLYYELCLLPGIEARVMRNWADMLSRLLSNKPGLKRKLEAIDLQLSWQPLWRSLQKELWTKKRLQDSGRNVVNILLYVAEQCKLYYPASEIPDMLSTFIPIITKESITTMAPVLTSFLPPAYCNTYLPALFTLWNAFNSSVLDDRFLELAGSLSEEHVAGKHGNMGEGGVDWKDIGIWAEREWSTLVSKGLNSMNVPVGATSGMTTTAAHADYNGDRQSLRIKKAINRQHALAKIIVFSMAVDGPVRESTVSTPAGVDNRLPAPQVGYIAGSKALDTLDRLITSTESFFHPSNAGPWSIALTTFLHQLATEFCRRIKEEEHPSCKTPSARRLTPAIRRNFVKILQTPALIAMFSKDPLSMSYAQGALRSMAYLEPNIIMPELLERAFEGLEIVNETHRTTAVISMLSGVCRPLVTEKIWPHGQRHLVPLLELCIPGIDLNDPVKTICTTMFIISAVQHIKIGDLSIHHSKLPPTSEALRDEMMEVDNGDTRLPDGNVDSYSIQDERALARDSTAGFADWVASLFRRVFALFENLPEEGGRRNITGGKSEENVLKSIKSMLDVVCLHLSDQLFDLVLNLVYNYATTNAKSNAVRASGQLIACLARAKPKETIAKFLPYCASQVEEELRHGASSLRTTSSHAAVPSDTTLHWNLSILRGCLGYGGPHLLRYKKEILDLIILLIDKTKSERGYTAVGRLIARVLHTLVGVYPLNSRFLNTEEWEDSDFDKDHNAKWGKLYDPEDVKLEWHVASSAEITFVLEFLDSIETPLLDKIEMLLRNTPRWDSAERNDFCRYLSACKHIWSGLPMFVQEPEKNVVNPCLNEEIELPNLLVTTFNMKAGFTLTDPCDPRYQKAMEHRMRFGSVVLHASSALRQKTEGEDHIDAVVGVTRAIDRFLLEYGMTRSAFDSLQKGHAQARELNRMWYKQKENSRLVFVKRAQMYHSGRVYMHALYRRRSALDDRLLEELVELSLSPYTRIRRHAQSVLQNVCGYFLRSTRFILPPLFGALVKGNDPDRMKGALYVLGNKGIAAYALGDQLFQGRYLTALLECQHEEKPSVQKLVNNLAQDCLTHLTEEAAHTDAYTVEPLRLTHALHELEAEFSPLFIDKALLLAAMKQSPVRVAKRNMIHSETISSILEIASRPNTHWRYVQMAMRFLFGLLRRDVPSTPELGAFLLNQCINPQPTIRVIAQNSIVKLTTLIKIRTYSRSSEELWLDEWKGPLREEVVVEELKALIQHPLEYQSGAYVDKIPTGLLAWSSSVKGQRPVIGDSSVAQWEQASQPCLGVMSNIIKGGSFLKSLSVLWSQESSKAGGGTELRSENVTFIKSLAKSLEHKCLDDMLQVINSLVLDVDRFKQRAGVEFLAGLLRGSKLWARPMWDRLWSWTIAKLDTIYPLIKPDTLAYWEALLSYQFVDRDPRRVKCLVDWTLGQPIEFQSDSAFTMHKSLAIIGSLVDCAGIRFGVLSDRYVRLFLDNANSGYAEIREQLAQHLYMIVRSQWQPAYPSTEAFLRACQEVPDPLRIQEARYIGRVTDILNQMQRWRVQRLPPPRVSQSEYDKVGLTLMQWIWVSAHAAQAPLAFPYAVCIMPEILRMLELNDSSELQTYSSAVLYILSAVSPPREYVQTILENFISAVKSSTSWRIRLNALPMLVVFFYRNLLSIPPSGVTNVMDVLLDCLSDENVEVRAMASKALSGIVRCSQRQSIVPLKNRFVALARKLKLPTRQDPAYTESLRSLHSAILGLCALIESFPYSVEPWMPALTEVLAFHATDPPPISTTIRKCASEFKKTHQDTWHKDQQLFNEEQLQNLSTMLVGTSYYA